VTASPDADGRGDPILTGATMNAIPMTANHRFPMSASHIPPFPDPDPVDPPGQDDLPGIPPEPLRDPERVPPLPVRA